MSTSADGWHLARQGWLALAHPHTLHLLASTLRDGVRSTTSRYPGEGPWSQETQIHPSVCSYQHERLDGVTEVTLT